MPSENVNNDVCYKTKYLTFLHWNVNGLMTKLCDKDFVSYVCSFDFICLVETFIDEFSSNVFSGFTSFCIPAVKFTTQGRRSGGLLCLIKNDFLPYVKKVNIKSSVCGAFIISRQLFGFDKDVLYVYSYVPPEGSPYYAYFNCENGIEILENYLTDCLMTYDDVYILLCGDLNGRTSDISHYCHGNDHGSILESQCVSHPLSSGRCSEDMILNSYGKLLLNMCTALDMCILNGMCHGDLQGCYTYVSNLSLIHI
eukprot:TRINITY_DN15544_c0_g1_i8.p2 TRINITY_DN15544_c0_g1~~TRINITY_DN15544_c0_g1_i8.p2  ORF type:complete len:254 (+),score=4.10 TRINITY_DN15544_c0_g1_i8:1461-2222(+)